MELLTLSAWDLRELLRRREVSSREVCAAYLRRIEDRDSEIGAFLHVDPETVLQAADQADRQLASGEAGSLAGLPVAVKDVLCTRDAPTTCGSKMLSGYRSPYDATIIERLKLAGAVVLGKTNMDEFAMGGSNENSAYRPAHNPWDTTRTPGGSSGGAAAAVAASMAPLSIGTDTGGSIRQPAAFCGVTGLKPTYGRISRYGLVAFASSLDQAGPLAHSAADVALLLDAISGHDPRDATSSPAEATNASEHLDDALAGVRIGVLRSQIEQSPDEMAAALTQCAEELRSLGAQLVDAALPHADYGVAAYYLVAPCEASSNLARFDGAHFGFRCRDARTLEQMYRQSRSQGLGPEVKRRMILGAFALSSGYYDAYYLKAQRVRRLIRDDYAQAFQTCDLLLGPVTPTVAFPLGEKADDPLQMYLGDLFTVGANLAGVPAISAPCGLDASLLPIGAQLYAPAMHEDRLLAAVHQYQLATSWHQRRPSHG